jgi:hypothetical protein
MGKNLIVRSIFLNPLHQLTCPISFDAKIHYLRTT